MSYADDFGYQTPDNDPLAHTHRAAWTRLLPVVLGITGLIFLAMWLTS